MIALIDCNNFYASCEKMFNPSVRRKPVVVLSNNDGCAIARSEEAKAIGIEMGTPAFKIMASGLGDKVAFFSSNYSLYGSMSSRVMAILRDLTPAVEVYSIDEAFADLSGINTEKIKSSVAAIRETIASHTGLPVSIGVATTKTLAKMANRYVKKKKIAEGYFIADASNVEDLLEKTRIGDVWGIGHRHSAFLMEHGIESAAQFAQANDQWVRDKMSVVGERLLYELRGIPAIGWNDEPDPKKNICTARSFGELLTDLDDISQAAASHSASCARKLRKEKRRCTKVHVFLQTNPYHGEQEQYLAGQTIQLAVPTNLTNDIISAAMKGLKMIFRKGYRYLKVGVMVQDLVPEEQVQLALYENAQGTEHSALMKTLDLTNQQYGKDLVRFGRHGYGDKWKLRAAQVSQRFTTRIDEVMIVKA